MRVKRAYTIPMIHHRIFDISVVVALLTLLSSCVRTTSNSPTQQPAYHSGQMQATVQAEAGPLQLELWRVDYEGGWEGEQQATRLAVPPNTRVSLRVHNTAAVTATVLHNPPPNGAAIQPPPPPAAYLYDAQGNRYPATGSGWSRTAETLHVPLGTVPPHEMGEFWLSFGGIPSTVDQLTLVVPDLELDSGERFSVEMAVPVP